MNKSKFVPKSPALIIFIITSALFISEALVMLLLNTFSIQHALVEALTDSLLLITLAAPALYFFVFKPIAAYILELESLKNTLLKNEEEQFKNMVRASIDGFWIIDLQGRFLETNDAYSKMTGYSRADLQNMCISDIDAKESPEETKAHIQQLIGTGSSSFETLHRCKDGRIIDVEISANYSNINKARIFCFLRDKTRQKSIEEALLKTTAQLNEAQRLSQIGSWELDLTNDTLRWSDEIFHIFEIAPAQFSASYEEFLNAIHPEDREKVNNIYTESVKNHTSYSIEHRLLFPDGRIKHAIERGETFYAGDGRPLRSIGTVQDITQRKLAEEAHLQAEAMARMIFDNVADAIVIHDVQGRFLGVNQVMCERLGYTREELLQLSPSDITSPESAEKFVARGEALKTQGHITFETEHIAKDGRLIPVEVNARLIEYAGHPATLSVVRDITRRIQLQAEETLLQEIDQQALRSPNLSELFKFICTEITKLFHYQFAWIGKKEDDGSISIAAFAGPMIDYHEDLLRIGARWDDAPTGQGPAGSCIRSGHIHTFRYSDPGFHAWRNAATRFNFKSMAGIPLILKGQVYGAFMLYSQDEKDFDIESLQRLSGIARRICIALEMSITQEQLHLFGAALESAGNSIFITDQKGRIQWINHSFTRLTGYTPEEALGSTPALLKSGKNDSTYYQLLWQTILQGEVWSNETVNRHKDGSMLTVRQTITPIQGEDGRISHFISILDDITAQKAAAAHINYMAHFDTLTDLPNRTLFYDRLRQALAQAKRNSHICALIFIDLDRFKAVNDTLGHHVGDLLLQNVAIRLKSCVRESDTVSRLAGDEFTVLLPDVSQQKDAILVAEKIIAILAESFLLEGHDVHIGCSCGIAFYPMDADTDEALIKCADDAMYEAKKHGRGTFRLYQQPNA